MLTDNITYISSLGVGFTALMCFLLLTLPRRWALVPVVILICYMTMGERVIVVGLNFTMVRILTAVGWVRILSRGEIQSLKLHPIDKGLIWFAISGMLIYVLQWQTFDAVKYEFGQVYNALGMYFLFRCLIRDMDDCVRVFKIAGVFIIPLAASMVVERMTGRNAFAGFGGVSPITAIRDGVLRCQGPFAHPVLAGTFGATLFPLFVGLWRQGTSSRPLSVLAVLSCGVMVFTSGSSGPTFTFLVGLLALAFWPLRKHMLVIRRGVVLTLVGLEIVMKADVWYLMARVDIFSGSTGYHRAYLIDRALANLGDWWLIGTKSTAAWADEGAHLFDVTNQYLVYGADGGLITMLLFILVIVRCFRAVGPSIRALGEEFGELQFCVWALAAALVSHVVTFLSVSYFDQNFVNWYLLLAMISTASLSVQGVPEKAFSQAALLVGQRTRPVLWNPGWKR